ncbi:Integrin beta-6 [Geodia barretti]|uniref:Integrin beta n=1 Tax=Geodia barretti TaxID=519541 RepID=A0AA35R2E3_GEOBA|nr:Integrin beta-6 [Geodia barretti]
MPWNTAALRLCCILSTLLWSSGNAIDCELRQTCSDCITIDLTCGWCADEGVRLDSRCRLNGMHTDCGNVFAPASEIVVPQEPPPATAISPETYNVSLRNTDTLSLPIDVTTVRNIPLDLYILFDVSQSMDEEISAIQGASAEIIARLQNITDDVQVGVGSYVDKATLPFSRRNLTQESGCIKPGGPCYNFRHYGRMTNSREELSERFSRIETGSNIDAPEAGLDAMAQAVICNESVGWRDSAVKMILTFTDDAFKFSGEGRQGGILTPFETVCGLTNSTETNSYTMYSGLRNDYTSPGQLLSFLESSNIIPVFVSVTSSAQAQGFYNVSQTHQELARLYNMRLSGRASFASVNTTGTNETGIANSILTIIDQQVLFILSQTGLSPERINGISFSVKAECPARAIELNEGTNMESCSNVSVGDTTRFTLNVKLLDCEVFGTETREVAVSVFPLGRVVIEITPICSCLCDDYEVNSPRCSFNGNFSCGECTCKEGYCGLQCQFNVSVRTGCPDGLGGNICSGERGACLGTCECVCEMNLTAIVDNPKLLRVGVSTRLAKRAHLVVLSPWLAERAHLVWW